MKPKHHKTIRCTRPKRQSQIQRRPHHHGHTPIDPSCGILVENDKSDAEENDADPLLLSDKGKKGFTKSTWEPLTESPSSLKNIDNNNEGDDDGESETSRLNALLLSTRERREQLVERLRTYNNLLKFHKTIKEDQVYLYRKLQDMDELYLRNTAAILRLGFCPCLVHQQTSPVGDILVKIHRKLRVWDTKMENICEILKEPSTQKTTAAVLQVLKIPGTKFVQEHEDVFSDIELPEVVWDLENPFMEQLNTPKLTEDWGGVNKEVRGNLCKAEMTFQEVCLEFGIRRGPENIPSSEYESRPIVYEHIELTIGMDDFGNNEQPLIKDDEEAGDGSSVDSSKVSSSFF